MRPKHSHLTGTAFDKVLLEESQHCNMLTSDSFSASNTYHTASDELDSAGRRGSIHSTQRHAQYYVGSMMDHLGCKSMTWSTPIDHNVSFLSVQISLASQVANYLEIALYSLEVKNTLPLTPPIQFKMQLVHSSCDGGEVQHQGQQILSGLSVVLSAPTRLQGKCFIWSQSVIIENKRVFRRLSFIAHYHRR